MSTPFPPNALITFPNAVVVSCYLKEASNRKNDDSTSGGEVVRLALEGRIDTVSINDVVQESAALPTSILPGTVGAITLTDPAGVAKTKEGEFFLEESLDSAFGISAQLGARIRGYLVRRVDWVDDL